MSIEKTFVYIIVSQNKQSVEGEEYHIYGIYEDMKKAVTELNNIYSKGILGTKHNTEYRITKKEIL